MLIAVLILFLFLLIDSLEMSWLGMDALVGEVGGLWGFRETWGRDLGGRGLIDQSVCAHGYEKKAIVSLRSTCFRDERASTPKVIQLLLL